MEREVRYCKTEDGVRIAYCVEGEGPALIVCPISAFDSFSLKSLMPELEDFYRQIGAGRTLIHYDMRGTGLSERGVEDFSLDATVSDLGAVADAAGLERFTLWAPGLSGPKAIKYVAQNPGRVSALILYGTFARARDAYTADAIQAFAALAESNWELFCRTINDMGAARTEAGDAPLRAAKYSAQSADGETIARWIRENEAVDVTPYLTAVSARTLVVHRIADSIYPIALGQALAAGIPGARLVTPPGAIAGFMWGDVRAITDAVNAFLDEDAETRRRPSAGPETAVREPSGAFRTVLFTDLVGHTEMMQRLGDERGRDVLREHERITREVLKSHRGTEVKTMGDGFMASFGSVTKAVECAIALQRAFEQRSAPQPAHPEALEGRAEEQPPAHGSRASPRAVGDVGESTEPIAIRIGLNAGEPIEEEGDLFGSMVILAARIAAQADGGEVLASMAVRELCAGKGFLFADRGEHVLRGFEDPVRMFEVHWRE